MIRIGLDVGSTTIKCVVLDDDAPAAVEQLIFSAYERHYARIQEKTAELLACVARELAPRIGSEPVALAIAGSAGMGVAETHNIEFIQEVYATHKATQRLVPEARVVIELGGEDAKIIFFEPSLDVCMNGTCAGGTGAFIDQMATLLNVSPDELGELALAHEKIYAIASRCGVFAKTDIQPLINQGARKEDIAASILHAVANQTIAGLAQGRRIGGVEGGVVYLGGPLTFLPALRTVFDEKLDTTGTCPENSLLFVAYGAALLADDTRVDLAGLAESIAHFAGGETYAHTAPLFTSQAEYDAFCVRHDRATAPAPTEVRDATYSGDLYLGVDAGSTTIKALVIDDDGAIIDTLYETNDGNPVPAVRTFLQRIYANWPQATLRGACATGYGEALIKNAFNLDFGIVETMAHFYAARAFDPQVEFIIDIGGQDIKCFHIRNGALDNLFLNEACSSGCGSFLQTFAAALDVDIEQFARLGLFAENPVDLGSRCTVFMNSSVKQAQKEGATLADISAGLSMSVVKNALYKVIRTTSPEQLGAHIVVQGGTFLNDAVLRAFEREIGREVVRPSIAGLMGAYGCALYAHEHTRHRLSSSCGATIRAHDQKQVAARPIGLHSCLHGVSSTRHLSSTISAAELEAFTQTTEPTTCTLCSNSCALVVSRFGFDRTFIGGNRCERPITGASHAPHLNLFAYKRKLIDTYRTTHNEQAFRGTVGIPLVLNNYELLPFWHTFFTTLGFEVVTSTPSTRATYLAGQHTIPSDTVCYPAKLAHGHIEELLSRLSPPQWIDGIFYPCMHFNVDEGQSENHFNCPIVAYYPETIAANVPGVTETTFVHDFVGIHRSQDFIRRIGAIIAPLVASGASQPSTAEIKTAARAAYAELDRYVTKIRTHAQDIIVQARAEGMPIIALCGRPYHIDPEVCHGIDRLICEGGAAVISEDALEPASGPPATHTLNQWTYHARLYRAAQFAAEHDDVHLIQLVSFGCGLDAITADEVCETIEQNGKIYTQIKIDEITNTGAVKIRLRSLFAAIKQGDTY